MVRYVFGISDWPENFGEEFLVFAVREGETENEAVERAKAVYSPNTHFVVRSRAP